MVQIKYSSFQTQLTMTFAGHHYKTHPLKSSTSFRPLIFSMHRPDAVFLVLVATALRPTIMKVEHGSMQYQFPWRYFFHFSDNGTKGSFEMLGVLKSFLGKSRMKVPIPFFVPYLIHVGNLHSFFSTSRYPTNFSETGAAGWSIASEDC